MMDLAASIAAQLRAWSPLEATAVVLAVAYLVLAIRQNIGCWICALISTAIYVFLFAQAKLYMEAFLNLFYFGMAIYGWIAWGGRSQQLRAVTVWSFSTHAIALVAIAGASALSGYLLIRFTDAALPFVDSLTTFAALWATFLVARKVLENWWYWLAIDAASIVIYWSRDLELTALLFGLYVLMIPFGLLAWTESYRNPISTAPA